MIEVPLSEAMLRGEFKEGWPLKLRLMKRSICSSARR